jgi:hypothetical protein
MRNACIAALKEFFLVALFTGAISFTASGVNPHHNTLFLTIGGAMSGFFLAVLRHEKEKS